MMVSLIESEALEHLLGQKSQRHLFDRSSRRVSSERWPIVVPLELLVLVRRSEQRVQKLTAGTQSGTRG